MATKTKAADAKKALVAEYVELSLVKLGLDYTGEKELLAAIARRTPLVLASDVAKLKQLGAYEDDETAAVAPVPVTVLPERKAVTTPGSGTVRRIERGITDGQLALIIQLMLEKAGMDLLSPDRADLLDIVKQYSLKTASAHISASLQLPRFAGAVVADVPCSSPTGRLTRSTPVMQNFPPVRTAAAAPAEIPAGIYAIVADDEVKCYTVEYGKKGGKWDGYLFLARVSSDDRWPVRNAGEKARILAAIRDMGIEESGRLAGHTLRQCRRCRRTLSDTRNPYFEMALGPDCGGM